LSTLGDQLLLFTLPVLVYKATGSIAISGLAFFIEWLPRIISLPIAGVFADRVGGRRVYLLADSLRACFCLLGFLVILWHPPATFLTAVVLMASCAFFYAQSFIALEATIPRLVKPEYYAHAQSTVQGIEQSTVILGPCLAAFLVLFFPIFYLLLFTASVFLLAFVGTLLLKQQSTATPGEVLPRKHLLREMQQGLKILTSESRLIWLVVLTIAINLVWGLALASNAAMVTGVFARSASTFGLLQTVTGVMGLLAFFVVPVLSRRFSVLALGVFAFLAMAAGGILIGITHHFAYFAIGYTLILAFDGVFNVYIRSERVKLIPQAHLGKTIGLIVLVNQLSLPLAGLLLAQFSHSLGVHGLFVILSLLALIIFGVFLLRQHYRRGANKN
jgi:MFS family permease